MKNETFHHDASGADLCRPLAQPHITSFRDLFTRSEPYIYGNPAPFAKITLGEGDDKLTVGTYCSRRDGKSLHVQPAGCVLSRIRERMISVKYDEIGFELVDHDNGWTLVLANYNQILGSLWLAYIRTASIPQPEAVAA